MSPATSRRHRGRELALRVLFEIEGTEKDPIEVLAYQADELAAPDDIRLFAMQLVQQCTTNLAAIDGAITKASDNWGLADIGKVERAVLRLSVAELLYDAEVPVAVAIDEAVELAKQYAGDGAGPFVNGVLAKVERDRHGGEQAQK